MRRIAPNSIQLVLQFFQRRRAPRPPAIKTGPGLVFAALGLLAAFFLIAACIFMVGLAGAFVFSAILGEE
jgi:hypothetical protein